MSMMVSFCAVLFPRDVLDEILNLIESVSEGFPTYSSIKRYGMVSHQNSKPQRWVVHNNAGIIFPTSSLKHML